MSARKVRPWRVSSDPMIHFVGQDIPFQTLCGVDITLGRGCCEVSECEVDCLTCLVRAEKPSIEDRMAAVLQLPLYRRFRIKIDGIVHLEGRANVVACGIILFDRTLDTIVKMVADAGSQDVDCMTCLIAETRSFK